MIKYHPQFIFDFLIRSFSRFLKKLPVNFFFFFKYKRHFRELTLKQKSIFPNSSHCRRRLLHIVPWFGCLHILVYLQSHVQDWILVLCSVVCVAPRNAAAASAVLSREVSYSHFIFRFDFRYWKVMEIYLFFFFFFFLFIFYF